MVWKKMHLLLQKNKIMVWKEQERLEGGIISIRIIGPGNVFLRASQYMDPSNPEIRRAVMQFQPWCREVAIFFLFNWGQPFSGCVEASACGHSETDNWYPLHFYALNSRLHGEVVFLVKSSSM